MKISSLLSSITTNLEGYTSGMRLVKRNPPRPHKLPRGWRWLQPGEWAREGDYCCDPRVNAVKIVHGGKRSWKMTDGCHPVRRKT
jgi:hypothetical protein